MLIFFHTNSKNEYGNVNFVEVALRPSPYRVYARMIGHRPSVPVYPNKLENWGSGFYLLNTYTFDITLLITFFLLET